MHTWVTNEIITANKMNDIENGIATLENTIEGIAESIDGVTDLKSALDSLLVTKTAQWKTNSSYPTGWRSGYFTGNIGDVFEMAASGNYARSYYRISEAEMDVQNKIVFVKVTPPSGYSVKLRVIENETGKITEIYNTSEIDEPVSVQHKAGNAYLVSLGVFSGDSATYAADANFVENIVFSFQVFDSLTAAIAAEATARNTAIETAVAAESATRLSEDTTLENTVEAIAKSYDGAVFLPCDDSNLASSIFEKHGMLIKGNGPVETTNLRLCIYGASSTSTTAPTYSNRPGWYHDPCEKFIIGHQYHFDAILVDGSIDRGELTTDFYYDLRRQSNPTSSMQIGVGDTWTCNFQPEMVAFVSRAFTFTNALIWLKITDITEVTARNTALTELQNYVRSMSPAVSVSDNVVAIYDAAPLSPDAMTVTVNPVQSGEGDPSPTNVRPITGWTGAKVTRTGKNLWSEGDKTFTRYIMCTLANRIPAGVYSFSAIVTTTDTESNYCRVGFYDSENKQIDYRSIAKGQARTSIQITLARDCYAIYLYAGSTANQSAGDTATFADIQIELGSIVTEFEPYQGNIYDITFPSEAGTVYGGTLDVTNGVLTVDRATVSVQASSFRAHETIVGRYFADFGQSSTFAVSTDNLCNIAVSTLTSAPPVGSFYLQSGFRMQLMTEYETLDAFVSAMGDNDVQLCGILAEPISYQLAPIAVKMLRGINNVWANIGDASLTYRKDITIKKYELPDYWLTEITTKANELAVTDFGDVGSSVRFAFVTDVHVRNADGAYRNQMHTPGLIAALRDYANIDLAFFGGDAITGGYASKANAQADLVYFKAAYSQIWPMMNCIFGNHDYGNNANNSAWSPSNDDMRWMYNILIRDKERQYTSVNPLYGSYVLDNTAQKVRFIAMNENYGGNYTQQRQWLSERLLETPSGYTIIIICHRSLTGTPATIDSKLTNSDAILPVATAYNKRETYNTVDFSNGAAKVACIIGGHCHYDGVVFSEGNTTLSNGVYSGSGIPVISTICDYNSDNLTNRPNGTVNEQAFDVVMINTSNKTIYMKRIGYGEDRTIVYN